MDSGSAEAIREIRRARTPHPRWDADPTRQARAAIEIFDIDGGRRFTGSGPAALFEQPIWVFVAHP
jgi:hypothetical protein